MKLKQGKILIIPLPQNMKERLCSDGTNPPLALVDLCDEDLDTLQKAGIKILESGHIIRDRWVHVYTKRKATDIDNKPIDDTYDFEIKTILDRGVTYLYLKEEK